MNAKQSLVLAVSVVICFVMLLFPPYWIPEPLFGFPMDMPPKIRFYYAVIGHEHYLLIYYPLLIGQLLAVMALTGIILYRFRQRHTPHTK